MIMYTLQDNGSSEFWSAVIFRSLAIGLGGSTCLFNNVSAAKIIKRFDIQKFASVFFRQVLRCLTILCKQAIMGSYCDEKIDILCKIVSFIRVGL